MKPFTSPILYLLAFPILVLADPVDIGSRLELFADDYLIGEIDGNITREIIEPEPKDVVFSADAPWEGNTSGYYTVFQDDDRIRLIYRGWAHQASKKVKELHPETTCYAESRDGLYFTKPNLGIHEWKGSMENNIVLLGDASHNFAAFKDSNPNCPPEALYKGIGGEKKVGGLFAFQSADGVHWKKITEKPVITDGAFDSQNIAFWDSDAGIYRAYYRVFSEGGTEGGEWKPKGVRAIRTAVSEDYINWKPGIDLTYPEGTPSQHLYTNAVQPYFRAPHLLVGFPTRYLPDEGQRVEPIFMISRNGTHFTRYNAPVIPESAPVDRAGNRSNYMVWGMVNVPSEPNHISVYGTEAYYGHEPGRLRRFVYRVDGFVALRAGKEEGEITTKLLNWTGEHLYLNTEVKSGGYLKVELRDKKGAPLSGYALSESKPFSGDSISAKIKWKDHEDLSAVQGRHVTLRIVMKDADLYSIQFRDE